MSSKIKGILSGALLAGTLWMGGGIAQAASYRWIGPDDGVWNNTANWSPHAIPGAGDDVVIDGKRKVSVPVDTTVANLSVGPGAEVKNGGQLKVTGKTSSSGLFTGIGTLDVPEGATATYDVNSSSVLATGNGTTPAVVFAPISNKGHIVTKVASGCRVDFASIDNSGSTQITSDGTVTFKDIKNAHDIAVSASGNLTLAKIENSTGGSVSIAATTPASPIVPAAITRDGGSGGGGGGGGGTVDPSVVHLDDLINHSGGKVKLSGSKGGRSFDGKAIRNDGDLQISGAQTLLESDVINSAGATLTIDSDARLFPATNNAPKLNNSGKLIKSAGSDATLNVEWTNSGQVVVESGTLHVRVPAGKGCKQTGGTTTLEQGVLAVEDPTGALPNGTFEVAGGIVNGIGTIQGNVLNSGGHFKPGHSPGTITINGNFTQTAGGVLDMELGGTTPGTGYDQILVNGTAYLNGTLNLVRWGGFVPKNGDVYTLFTYYAKVGNFTQFVDTLPVPGITYDTTLTPTDYEVNCFSSGPIDVTPPVVAISNPLNGKSFRSIASATGKATDAVGVKGVTCRLYRYFDPVTNVPAAFWAGGTTWTPTASDANDEPAQGTTAWSFAFPPLVPGRYALYATATDTAGNKASSPTVGFWVDPTPPSVLTIDAPANGASLTTLTSLGGMVSDASNGSGIISVQGQLRRVSDGLYWNGSTWSATVFSFSNYLLAGARWGRTTYLPSGTNLIAGRYTLTVVASDRTGNTKTATSTFNVIAADSSIKSG